jgi:hypothetical protein
VVAQGAEGIAPRERTRSGRDQRVHRNPATLVTLPLRGPVLNTSHGHRPPAHISSESDGHARQQGLGHTCVPNCAWHGRSGKWDGAERERKANAKGCLTEVSQEARHYEDDARIENGGRSRNNGVATAFDRQHAPEG